MRSMSAILHGHGASAGAPRHRQPPSTPRQAGQLQRAGDVAHAAGRRRSRTADIEIEQELSRPYAYVVRMPAGQRRGSTSSSLKDPAKAQRAVHWRIENPELHQGRAALDTDVLQAARAGTTTSSRSSSGQGGPDADLGAVVFDVTGLPDTSRSKRSRRIRAPEAPGGFHNIFTYKHSDGRALLFATVPRRSAANVYDIEQVLAGDANQGLVGRSRCPDVAASGRGGYHDFYVGYDPATQQDKFYGAGGHGGYYVFDVTKPDEPKLLTSITGVAGIDRGHTFTPTPDGRYAVAETEYQYAPLRIFDLKPGLDGTGEDHLPADRRLDRRLEEPGAQPRSPLAVCVRVGYEDGLHVFNMMDPTNPVHRGLLRHLRWPARRHEDSAYVRGAGPSGAEYQSPGALSTARSASMSATPTG